jgi:hypothetical protein
MIGLTLLSTGEFIVKGLQFKNIPIPKHDALRLTHPTVFYFYASWNRLYQISEIDRRIQELVSLRGEISGLIEDWNPAETVQTGEICPVIQRESR